MSLLPWCTVFKGTVQGINAAGSRNGRLVAHALMSGLPTTNSHFIFGSNSRNHNDLTGMLRSDCIQYGRVLGSTWPFQAFCLKLLFEI
jgi:hypothetical protein